MPLTLVTGPANAEKARVVLDAHVAAAAREPLLVVPTLPDVDRYRRELAGRGYVFGAEVLTQQGLVRELARRAGHAQRPLGALTRERVAAAAIARTPLRVLAASSHTPGFLKALLALQDELTTLRVGAPRWTSALRTWAAAEPGRAAYADELGALGRAYAAGVERSGRPDAAQHAVAAIDALRAEPARWRGTPVLLYGFDDLTLLQRDVVESLSGPVGAEVTVSLPFEPGREAFAGSERTYQELLALGAERVELPAVEAQYAAPVLHHLERFLYEPSAERFVVAAAAEPAAGVRLLRGGGERAEVELVGARVVRLLRDGVPPDEIAVAIRRPETMAALVEGVFSAYGIPFALERRVPAGHTALGRGVLALLRSALLGADADELLALLRTPGFLRRPELADQLEAEVRRRGLRSAAEARGAWEAAGRFPLELLDRCAAAHGRGMPALCRWLAEETGRLLAAPHRGLAPVLEPAQEAEARVAAALRGALRELAGLEEAGLLPDAEELVRLLGELPVRVGRRAAPDLVTVADPLAIRARRVRALFVCGLQEGAFPSAPAPEPFLGDAERRALNAATGLRLELREDAVGAERSLFYAAVSRPTDELVLSWHDADDEGKPAVRSLFVDDVLDLLPEGFEAAATERRELGAAGWADPALAPTAREAARSAASLAEAARDEHVAPLRDPLVLAELRGREEWSASAIEQWVACPVKWFVERHLRAEELVPDPEPMVRGALAHKVLEEALQQHDAGAPLVPADAPRLRELAHAALARHAAAYPISTNPERLRAALRRLEADVVRYVEWAAHAGSALTPTAFELAFGGREERPAVDLGGLLLQGRIDRVDVGADGTALLYDYKGSTAAPQARWLADGKLQLALYMLALPHLLEVEAVGGLYQPLGGADEPRPRGLVRGGADGAQALVGRDRVDDAAFTAVLEGALAAAVTAVGEIRAGRLEPRPATCGWRNGGCTHPSVCRAEGL